MREFRVDREGVRLFVREDGSGPAIVMLHGPMADHGAVLPLVAPLADRHRVITPDLRGSGRSWWGGDLTFDQLADDLASLLDAVDLERAVIGGVSGGSGVALRFALRHPDRTRALMLVHPVYAGEERGYTADQQAAFAAMHAVASRAPDDGIQVLRPLYANLPPAVRDRALAMIERFDPASVAATSRFIASGAQPFRSAADLRSVSVPTVIVPGDDPLHPAGIADFYGAHIPGCAIPPSGVRDVPSLLRDFCERQADSP